MKRRARTTNLWLVVERLQLRLEQLGLDREVVDEAVTKSVSALVDALDEPQPAPWFVTRQVAQA